jgi:hypothetical protein
VRNYETTIFQPKEKIMDFEKIPQLTEEQICELSKLLFEFYQKISIPEEQIPNIVVELKYKLPVSNPSLPSLIPPPSISVSLGDIGCVPGDGRGCGIGWKYSL